MVDVAGFLLVPVALNIAQHPLPVLLRLVQLIVFPLLLMSDLRFLYSAHFTFFNLAHFISLGCGVRELHCRLLGLSEQLRPVLSDGFTLTKLLADCVMDVVLLGPHLVSLMGWSVEKLSN